jgi:hypothetical protein
MADEWNVADKAQANETDMKSVQSSKLFRLTNFTIEPAASQKSGASKTSFSSRVKEAKKKEAEEKPEWNQSTTSEQKKFSAEDRMASQIASEVLKDNAKLRGVHSKESIKAILESEAKRQLKMANGGSYQAPVISRIVESDKINK